LTRYFALTLKVPPTPSKGTILAFVKSKVESAVNSSRIHLKSRASIGPVTVRSVIVVLSVAVRVVLKDPAAIVVTVFVTCADKIVIVMQKLNRKKIFLICLFFKNLFVFISTIYPLQVFQTETRAIY